MTRSVARWLVLCPVVCLLLAGLPLNRAWASPAPPAITVIFRCDDYCSSSPTDMEIKIIDAFHQRNMQCSFMAIPSYEYVRIPPDKIQILNRALDEGAIDLGLHGLTHNVLRKTMGFTHLHGSEFNGIYYNEQEHRIAEGKAMLEQWTSRKVTIFCPPYNSYDLDTLRALDKLGFTCVSASICGDVLPSSKLKLVPALCDIDDVRHQVELARKVASGTPTMIIIETHAHEISDEDPVPAGHYSFALLTSTLDWLKEQKDVRVLSISQALEIIPDLDNDRFLANKPLFYLHFGVPTFLDSYYPDSIYFTAERAGQVWRQWAAYLVLIYSITTVVPAILAFAFAAFVFPSLPRLRWVFLILATLLFLIMLVYGSRSLFQTYHVKLAITVLFGGCLGLWLYWLKARKRPSASS